MDKIINLLNKRLTREQATLNKMNNAISLVEDEIRSALQHEDTYDTTYVGLMKRFVVAMEKRRDQQMALCKKLLADMVKREK